MDGFTIIDAIVAIVIILSAVLAYSRGFVREGWRLRAGSRPRCWPICSPMRRAR